MQNKFSYYVIEEFPFGLLLLGVVLFLTWVFPPLGVVFLMLGAGVVISGIYYWFEDRRRRRIENGG